MKRFRIPWLTRRRHDRELQLNLAFAFQCLDATPTLRGKPSQLDGAVIMSTWSMEFVSRDYQLHDKAKPNKDGFITNEAIAACILQLPVVKAVKKELTDLRGLTMEFDPKTQSIVLRSLP